MLIVTILSLQVEIVPLSRIPLPKLMLLEIISQVQYLHLTLSSLWVVFVLRPGSGVNEGYLTKYKNKVRLVLFKDYKQSETRDKYGGKCLVLFLCFTPLGL